MNPDFFIRLSQANAGLKCRNALLDVVLKHPELLPDLVRFAIDLENKNHYKGIWMLEMLAEKDALILQPFASKLLEVIPEYEHESAIRGASRIVLFMSRAKPSLLNASQQQQCIEIALDWLINDEVKIAPKANALYTLAHYAKGQDWLKEELRQFIGKDFANQSAGYQAAAKKVLKHINY